jgi:hypothetical protein
MEDKLKKIYDLYVQSGLINTTDFESFAAANDQQKKKLYDLGKQNGLFKTTDYNTFSGAFKAPAPVKKKSTSASQSVQKKKPTSSATMPSWMQSSLEQSSKKDKGPRVAKKSEASTSDRVQETIGTVQSTLGMALPGTGVGSGLAGKALNKKQDKEFDVYYGYPGQEKNKYRITNGRWERKYGEKWVEVTNQGSINALTKFFNKEDAILKDDNVFTGFPGKEENKYRVHELQNGQKVWEVQRKGQNDYTVISDKGSIDALNRQFNKKIQYSEEASLKREAQINRKESASEDFKTITGKLVGKEEDEVVDYLNKKYGDRGFTFKPEGFLKDRIRVRAIGTDKSEVFELDNWTDRTDSEEARKLRNFLSENQQLGDYIDVEREEKKQSKKTILATEFNQEDLEKQMDRLEGSGSQYAFKLAKKQNEAEIVAMDTKKLSPEYNEAKKILIRADYDTNQRIDDLTRNAKTESEKRELAAIAVANKDNFVQKHKIDNEYLNDLNKSSKEIGDKFKELNSDVDKFNLYIKENKITKEQMESDPELIARKEELQSRYDTLIADADDFDFENKKIPFIQYQNSRNAALYFAYNETRGSVIGSTWNGLVRGFLSPLQTFRVTDKEGLDNIVAALGSSSTSEFASSEERSDLSKALLSTSESLGAAVAARLTGGIGTKGTVVNKMLSFLPFFSISYNEMQNEINNIPGMSKVPWYKKEALSIAYGLGVGYLDKLSTDFQIKGKISSKIGRDLVLRSIAGLPKGATAEAIEMSIASNLRKSLAAGTLKIVAGSLVEGITEGTQSVYGTALKEIYDWTNNVDEFDSREWIAQAIEESYYGALGGSIMSTPSTLINGAKDGFARLNPVQMELARKVIEDSNMRSMVITDIKAKLMSGEITKQEADDQMNAIKESQELFAKIPENLSPEDTSKAMDLIKERSKIESDIKGKDKELVTARTRRITAINNELKTISENATKESEQQKQEVTAEGGGVQREGVVEGQPEVGQPEGGQRETTEQGTDLGNRPVESRSKEEIDARVSELEAMLADDAASMEETGTGSLLPEARVKIQEELNILKSQEQARVDSTQKNIPAEDVSLVVNNISTAIEDGKSYGYLNLEGKVEDKAITVEDVDLESERVKRKAEKGTLTAEDLMSTFFGKTAAVNEVEAIVNAFNNNPSAVDEVVQRVKERISSDTSTTVTSAKVPSAKPVPPIAETTDTKTYSEALSSAKAELKAEGKGLDLQVSDVSKEEADQIVADGGKIFMTEDGLAGAYVKKDGYMGGLFKSPKAKYKDVAKLLQQARIKVGGRFMDAYATELEKIYVKNGFRPVARLKFNEEYAPEGWDAPGSALASKPDVVFFAYDPDGKYKIGDGEYMTDYDAAYEMAKNFDAKVVNEADKLAELMGDSVTVEVSNKQAGKLIDDIYMSNDVVAERTVLEQIGNATKALKSILPNVKFVIHNTDESFREATGENNVKESSAGAYDPSSKTIHINLTKANARTVMHETFHAIIASKTATNAQLQKLTRNMVNSVIKSLKQSGENQNTIDYLEEFASNYEANEQNEEKLSELFALLGNSYKNLPLITKNIIQRFLERIAKMFGLKPMTDNEVVSFMSSLSGKVEAGIEITAKEAGIKKGTIKKIINKFQANFNDETSGLSFVYDKNGEKFSKLEEDGFITKDKSIKDFDGQYMFIHQPDGAFSGMIYKFNKKTGENELLVEGKGGVYYPIKFHENGYFWASTNSVAEKMAKDLNEAMEKNGGKLLMALTTAPYDKLLSSTTAANAVMDLISSKAFDKNFDISPVQLKKILINAAAYVKKDKVAIKKDEKFVLDKNGNKTYKIVTAGLNIKINKTTSLDEVQSKIKDLLNPDNSSFADRKAFVEAMIRESVDTINSSPKAISQFGDFFSTGIQNKYFKGSKKGGYNINATNMTQAISEMLTEPMLKEGVNRDRGGQIYAVIELNGKVKSVDSDLHESYPKAIQSVDPNNKVTLHILTDRVNWNEVTEDFDTNEIVSKDREKKIFPSSGISVRALKINTKNVAKKEEESTPKAQINKEAKALDNEIDTDKSNFKKQKPSKQAAMIVKKGKEAGFSDAGIREYMKRKGYTDRQATDAIQSYNDKKEGIFIDPEWSKLRRAAVVFKRKFLSARGLMPNSVFALNENRQADIAKSLNMAEKTIVDFNRAMKKVPKADRDKVRKDFDDYIRGYTEVTLPVDLKKVADTMRAHIDSMSESLMNSGLVDVHTAEKIKDNLGEYLTRSYKVYDRANWKNEVEEEVKQRAINFLKTQYMPMAQEIADKEGMDVDDVLDTIVTNKFNEILTKDGAENFITGGKIGSKDTSILKERQDIPLEIRMLMGEYTDPAQNYAKTILKMSALAANHQFLTEVKNNGTGVFLFKKDDPRRPKGFDYMIAAEGSDTMNPLNGMYTTKEIKEEFEKQPAQLGAIMETYMRALSLVKWGKTIGSLMTHMKNVFGNLGFVLLNGHWRVNEMGRAYKTVKNDLFSKDKEGLRNYMNKLIELGIVKQSAGIGELRAMFKDADWDTAMIERINKNTGSKWDWVKSKFSKGAKFMEDLYQSEDDFFKIVAYENELSRYSKAMFGKSKNELTEEERAEVDKVVAEIVKNTYPTYSRIPELVNMIRRFPFVGNFISFQAESYRTAFNTAILAKDEIKSDNPGVRKIGAQRLVGSITYMSAKTAILSYFSHAAGMGAVGILGYFTDDDEEKQKEDDVRKFIAPWSKNSDLIVLKASNGKVQYIDFSSSDPHGGINKAINSAFIGKTTVDGFINALGSAIEPFIGEEMTTAAILAVKNNIDAYGKPIYNPEDTFYEKAKDISAYMLNVVQPGTVSTARKMYESDSKLNEAVGAATGMRIYDVDVAKSFGYSMITYRDRMEDAKRIYNSEVYNKDATEKSIADAKKRAERAITKINEEIYDRYYAAVRLGANEDILFENLKTFGRMSLIDMKFMFGQVPYLLREKAAPEEE